jgi:hypothetical protein
VWNIEWNTFLAKWNPTYTADKQIVRTVENMRKPRRTRSVPLAHWCLRWRYWKESQVKKNSAMERRKIMPKNELVEVN